MKKLMALSLIFAMLLSVITIATATSAPEARLDISITTRYGVPIAYADIGDVIRVTVSMTDFPRLASMTPSIHFNPLVVQVSDRHGTPLNSEAGIGSAFFERGEAFLAPGSTGWGGILLDGADVDIAHTHPFLRNETGVIGMFLVDPLDASTLYGTQTVYSVYMVVVGSGDADIRLTRNTDADYDRLVYSHGEPRFARYDFSMETFSHQYRVNLTPPRFESPLPASTARVYTQSGRRVERLSDVRGEDIFARLDRTGTNIPETARIVLAVYDNGRFYNISIGGSDLTGYVSMPSNISTSTIKVFVWTDLGNMRPIFRELLINTI